MPVVSAIDVGSNAIRMVIAAIENKKPPRILYRCRELIRLGQDVFSAGMISELTTQHALEAFKKFRSFIDQYHVDRIRAVGTSALREATNRVEVVNKIAAVSGIDVTVISGEEESRLISKAVAAKVNLQNKNTVLFDIGGGSVEVIVLENGRISTAGSYNIGSMRLLQMFSDKTKDTEGFISLVRDCLESAGSLIKNIKQKKINLCIGTGGNIEVLGELRKSLLKKRSNDFLHIKDVKHILDQLQALSYEERIVKMHLQPDRADVILPATVVLEFLMKLFCNSKIIIPHVSIKDGIIIDLTEETT